MPTFIKAGFWKKSRKPLEGELDLDRLIREVTPPAKNNLKNINSQVVSNVYTLTKEDFFKTLVYTGSASITIEITSSLLLVSADFFNVLQFGTGEITIGGSGVNIEHTTDVLPTSFGPNSLMTVLVYDATNVIVSGNLKLA